MLRKLFFTTTLILGMSSLASSHDCAWPGTRSCTAGKDTIIIRTAVKPAPRKVEAADPSLLRIMYV